MKLATLQGMREYASPNSMNGLSRVTPTIDYSVNGFQRVNYQGDQKMLQGLMLSGLMLSGHKEMNDETVEDFATYLDECVMMKIEPSEQGYAKHMMQGRAERRAKRAARKARRKKRRFVTRSTLLNSLGQR